MALHTWPIFATVRTNSATTPLCHSPHQQNGYPKSCLLLPIATASARQYHDKAYQKSKENSGSRVSTSVMFTSTFQVLHEGVSLEEAWSHVEPRL